jgi:hypothetical protein
MNKIKPTVEEMRSFMHFQELVLLFAKKENKILEKSALESEKDDDGDESAVKQCSRKENQRRTPKQ